jgi:hypothetical protein
MTETSLPKSISRFSPVKWVLAVLLLLLVLSIGGVVYLFSYLGGVKIFESYTVYKSSLAYLDSLEGEKKVYESDRFFATRSGNNLYGGILAAAWDKGLWVWGEKGLKYYSSGETLNRDNTKSKGLETALYYVNGGCAEALEEIQKRYDSKVPPAAPYNSRFFENIESNPFIELHLHNYKWRSRIRPGNYIQVKTDGNSNRLEYASVISEFKAPDSWIICNVGSTTK